MAISPGIRKAFRLLADGRLSDLREKVLERKRAGLHSANTGYGLRRDLRRHLDPPAAKIPISIRKLDEGDVPALFRPDPAQAGPKEQWELAPRYEFLQSGTPTCYVAVDERSGRPCYFQWLIGAAHNAKIAEMGSFPQLRPDEALLEYAYTPVAYRGLGIMSAAMARIAERAADLDARYVITFVARDNLASLKGCEKAGFSPYLLRRQTQYCFNLVHRSEFEPLPNDFRLAYPQRAAAE